MSPWFIYFSWNVSRDQAPGQVQVSAVPHTSVQPFLWVISWTEGTKPPTQTSRLEWVSNLAEEIIFCWERVAHTRQAQMQRICLSLSRSQGPRGWGRQMWWPSTPQKALPNLCHALSHPMSITILEEPTLTIYMLLFKDMPINVHLSWILSQISNALGHILMQRRKQCHCLVLNIPPPFWQSEKSISLKPPPPRRHSTLSWVAPRLSFFQRVKWQFTFPTVIPVGSAGYHWSSHHKSCISFSVTGKRSTDPYW